MILWLKAGAIGALAGALAGGWVGYEWRDGQAAKADRERLEAAERQRIRNADRSEWGARSFEEERDAIRRDLLASMPRTAPALASAVPQCPAVAVGDVVLPAGALDRVRAAAGELGPAADPGQPRPAVPSGPGAADR